MFHSMSFSPKELIGGMKLFFDLGFKKKKDRPQINLIKYTTGKYADISF